MLGASNKLLAVPPRWVLPAVSQVKTAPSCSEGQDRVRARQWAEAGPGGRKEGSQFLCGDINQKDKPMQGEFTGPSFLQPGLGLNGQM